MFLKSLFLITFFFASQILISQVEVVVGNTTLTEREVAVNLDVPWEIVWGHDDFIWATERKGRVLHINPTTGNTTVILDIQDKVFTGQEPGLLGMALHPDFNNTPKVFLIYTSRESFASQLNISSFDWNGQQLINENNLLVISASSIQFFTGLAHNGARIVISEDNKLFVSIGDGGTTNTAQDLSILYGKILRLNLDGSIPIDNPIPESYIYSYGHRNPQGLAFGQNGILYSTEHGPVTADELNIITPNKNYGWPEVIGVCSTTEEISFCQENDVVEPLTEWTPCVAISDLLFYNHNAIPEWKEKLLITFLGGYQANTPGISAVELDSSGEEVLNQELFFSDYGRIRDVCSNPHNGAIYFATNGGFYPGQGPNRIIEYRNLDYSYSSTSTTVNQNQFLKVSPNIISTNKTCLIECSTNFIGQEIQLYSYQGKLMKELKISNTSFMVDLGALTKGKYFIKSTNAEGTISKTIIVY